jgi:hypothetical protein
MTGAELIGLTADEMNKLNALRARNPQTYSFADNTFIRNIAKRIQVAAAKSLTGAESKAIKRLLKI